MHLGLLKSTESARQKKTSALIREFSVASRKKWNYSRLVNSFMRWIVFYLLHLIDAILACSNSLQNVNRDNIDFILDSISSSHSVVPNQMERIIWFVFYHLAKTWVFKGWNLTIMIIDLILLSKSICAMIFRSPKILKKIYCFLSCRTNRANICARMTHFTLPMFACFSVAPKMERNMCTLKPNHSFVRHMFKHSSFAANSKRTCNKVLTNMEFLWSQKRQNEQTSRKIKWEFLSR